MIRKFLYNALNIEEKAHRFLTKHITDNFEEIEVESGKCRYNYRCHYNAIHEAIENGDDEIAVVMYSPKGREFALHFLNIIESGDDTKYVDNTVGNLSMYHDYYLIEKLSYAKFCKIDKEFGILRTRFNKELPFMYRFLLGDMELL